MRRSILTLVAIFVLFGAQAQTQVEDKVDLSSFTLSNTSSSAFILVEETPTAIYTPDNLKALVTHVQENFGESLSIEVAPYFFINTKRKDRTYQKYIGVMEDAETHELKQNPFSGLNTTTVSLAYVNKEFGTIEGDRKTFSVGARTTILRFYNKEKVHNNTKSIADILSDYTYPQEVLIQGSEAIKKYYKETKEEINEKLEPFKKEIKPLFRLDGAIGYSALFKENSISSGTANRFGTWLTAETSVILNEGSEAKTNNYFNLLCTARYIEDGFNVGDEDYFTSYYRDIGGKMELEFGRFGFGYEYISRTGTITTERSVGNIRFTINKDISITGGFGKDFEVVEDENLVTIFGIHWGLNTGNSKVQVEP